MTAEALTDGAIGPDGILSPDLKTLLQETAQRLKGSERRMFMAKTARLFGPRGQRRAARELGWDRKTLRKGEYELQHGPIPDQFAARGRKKNQPSSPPALVRHSGDSQTRKSDGSHLSDDPAISPDDRPQCTPAVN